MKLLTRWRSLLPALLAFSLLFAQVAIPWTVSWFATEDGPSHVYSAMVARNLVLNHGHTHFSSVYQINRRILPNWTATILLAAIEQIAGVDYAEKVMASLCILVGFFAFAYAVRCFAPNENPFTPVANFLLQTWFLWVGFYNFYLAMLLALAVIGYYARGDAMLTIRRGLVLGAGLLALFFTQLLGAALAMITLGLTALWIHAIVPGAFRPRTAARWRQIGAVALAMLPVLLLAMLFARSSPPIDYAKNEWLGALLAFPLHVFASAPGLAGGQVYVWPAVLSYMVAAVFLMTRAEWRSAKGGLVLATIALFGLYVAVPDEGFGGAIVKVRFAWGVFLLGGVLAATTRRLRRFQLPMAIYIGGFLIGNLVVTSQTLSDSSDLIGDYLAGAGQPQRAASMIRYRYPTPDLPARYAIEGIGRDPLFHLDALIAARCRCLDLSDYEALSETFPIVFRSNVDRGLQFALWGMEGPGANASDQYDWLSSKLPVPIDYVVIVADSSSPPAGRDKLRTNLSSGMRMVSHPGKDGFVEAYQRTTALR
jgi:hypothetical protein